MRVSGGELRSRIIAAPPGDAVRPTPGRVREALFSILGLRIDGARVLDLFAGTGGIGIEALSRGAAHATFVEMHAPTARRLRATVDAFGIAKRASVVCAPAERVASRLAGRFDLVYADPPYALPPPHLTFANLLARGALDARTILVYEHRAEGAEFVGPGFETTRRERYGDVALQFVRIVA